MTNENLSPTKALNKLGCEVQSPKKQTTPLVFSSPHSGRKYPADLLAASKLDAVVIRRSEDAFVDEIFASAIELGAPLLRALFPRAYVDPNREAYELDPNMFEDMLPDHALTDSPRIAAGLGTIPRVVADGIDIYHEKLRYADACNRIEYFYCTYHKTLKNLIKSTKDRFGGTILIDCHSMPSFGAPGVRSRILRNVDIVLGDNHGTSCTPEITDAVENTLSKMGYRVKRNTPYSGGYITQNYGLPEKNIHALQIEINRALYMDELTIQRSPGLHPLARNIKLLIQSLADIAPTAISYQKEPSSLAAE